MWFQSRGLPVVGWLEFPSVPLKNRLYFSPSRIYSHPSESARSFALDIRPKARTETELG